MNTVSPARDETVFSFTEKPVFQFQDSPQDTLLSHEYSFTNVSSQPLIINKYEVSCSCTHAYFSQQPILPNQKSTIKVTFDTSGKYGYQDRTVQIYNNLTKKPVKLRFKVYVYSKSDTE